MFLIKSKIWMEKPARFWNLLMSVKLPELMKAKF